MLKFRLLENNENELNEYHRMRYTLWPKHTEESMREEMMKIVNNESFYNNELSWTVFVVEREDKKLGGFIEITLYLELSFCDSKPVAFIEGWFIDEDLREKGLGRALIHTAENWAREVGCIELASDVEVKNLVSQHAHAVLGFSKLHSENGSIFYKKNIQQRGDRDA